MKHMLLIIFMLVSTAFADDAEDILEEVQQTYKNIKYLKVDFEQINKFKLSGIENRSTGTMYITSDDRFRFESEQQTVVTDGKTIWSYSPINKQLVIDLAKKSKNTMVPRELLFSYGDKYYANLIRSYEENGNTWHLIKLTPKPEHRSAISSMKILVNESDWMVYRIEYLDMNDNSTIYEVKKIKLPKDIDEGTFKFSAPENTKIVDLTKRHG